MGLNGVPLWVRRNSFNASTGSLRAIAGATLSWSLIPISQATRLPLNNRLLGSASEKLCIDAVLMLFSLALGEKFFCSLRQLAVAARVYLVVFGSCTALGA
jgi:hypothetical protein